VRGFKTATRWLAGLFLLLVVVVFWLAGTRSGLNTLLRVADVVSPADISVQSVSGSLMDGAELGGIAVAVDGTRIAIDRLRAQCDCQFAVFGLVRFGQFRADGVDIEPGTPAAAGPARPPTLPLSLIIDDLQFNEVTIRREDAEPYRVPHLSLRVDARFRSLSITDLHLVTEDFQVRYNGRVALERPFAVDSIATFDAVLEDRMPVYGRARLRGDVRRLALRLDLESPLRAAAEFAIEDLLKERRWQGTLNADWSDLRTVSEELPPDLEARIALTATGTGPRLKAHGDLALRWPLPDAEPAQLQEVALQLETEGLLSPFDHALESRIHWRDLRWQFPDYLVESTAGGLRITSRADGADVDGSIDLRIDETIAGRVRLAGHSDGRALRITALQAELDDGILNATGAVDWQEDDPAAELDLDWQALAWSFPESGRIELPRGRGQLSLRAGAYTVDVESTFAGEQIPAGSAALRGRGAADHLQVESLRAELLGGSVSASGRAGWREDAEIDLQFEAEGIDPGRQWPDWPGRIDAKGKIQCAPCRAGFIRPSKFALELDAAGTLRDLPVKADIDAAGTPGHWNLRRLLLSSGSARFDAGGTVAESLDLQWQLRAPDLRALHPEAGGSLDGEGRIAGRRDTLAVTARLEGATIVSPWFEAGSVNGTIGVDMADNGPLQVDLQGEDLRAAGVTVNTLHGRVGGTLSSHTVELDLDADAAAVSLRGSGARSGVDWSGAFHQLDVSAETFGRWQLAAPLALSRTAEGFSFEEFCLTQEAARLCAAARTDAAAHWSATVAAHALPATLFAAALPQNLSVETRLDAGLEAGGQGGRVQNAAGTFRLAEGALLFDTGEAQPRRIAMQGGEGTLQFDGEVLNTDLTVTFAEAGMRPLAAGITLRGFGAADVSAETLSTEGRIHAGMGDLSPLSTMSPYFTDISGALDIDVTLSGTAASPRFSGLVRLRNGGFLLPDLGAEVQELNVSGTETAPGVYEFTGSMRSGAGHADITARLDEERTAPGITIRVTGESFEVVNLPEAWAAANPEIDLRWAPGRAAVSGRVVIPEARIHLDEVVPPTPLSADAVVLGQETAADDVTAADLHTDLQLVLGENITVSGQGISGRLAGELHITSREDGTLQGDGMIEIRDGSYSAYGQSLNIEQGRLIYARAELDNPRLSIRAVRTTGDVRAGVNITGHLTNPRVTLFSSPAMSQEQILAYIVFGRPLGDLNRSDGSDLIAAAAAMGLQNTGFLTNSLSSTFGLDELSVRTGATTESASLIIGKYLSPKLYLSYGMGLFQTLNTARLRYDITRRWALEAEHSHEMGVDLLYKIER
jgi:translocation and assembly module TamB